MLLKSSITYETTETQTKKFQKTIIYCHKLQVKNLPSLMTIGTV